VTELIQLNRVKDSTEAHEALETLMEPKVIMMSDIFSTHWAYRIPRSQARKLVSFDALREPAKITSGNPSNHHVVTMPENGEPLVYFKANGFQKIEPQKEFMHYNLYRHLQIPVPETALVILTNVFEATPNNFYAVQASEAVHGKAALETYQDPITFPLKDEAYFRQVIGAFLTNPSNDSLQNFTYSPRYQTLISTKNDHFFAVGNKSILYLFPQMENKPFPESIQTYFTTLDPHLTTFAWLKDLAKKNQEYGLLFDKISFQNAHYEVDGDKSFCPHIHVSKNQVNGIAEKLQKIERALVKNRSLSVQDLFEEVSPILAKYYQKLRLDLPDLRRAFGEAIWDNQKNTEEINDSKEDLCNPEDLFDLFKNNLATGATPFDKFIMKHNIRKMKNFLDLQEVLMELRILIQEGLTDSKSFKNVVEFAHNLPKHAKSDDLLQEIKNLLSNLPHPEVKWLFALENHFLRADAEVPTDLISVHGAFMGKRIFGLTESENKYLFTQQGDLKKNPSLTGRSNVTWFPEKEPQFFLKQYPEWPGYEYASSLFMRLLGVNHLPYQDLIIFNANSKINSYPVLLSQKVDGDLVLRVWNKTQAFSNLDPFHTGLLIIAAMLLNPEDGKEDNFILSKDRKYLIPIDNDHCFLPSTLRKEGNLWSGFTVNTALQTKTILFCLDEMNQPIPSQVKQHLLSVNFDELFTKWMKELVKVEDRYNNLANNDELRSRYFDSGTIMRIPFYEQFIESVHWKAHKIQDLLTKSSDLTPFDILKAVEPFAAKCYQDSFKQPHNTLESRFKAATHKLYTKTNTDGSRMSVLNTRAMMEIIHIPEKEIYNDPIFQKMGSIDALERLNQLIQGRTQKIAIEKELLCELDDKHQDHKWFSLFGNPVLEKALKDFFKNPKEGLALKRSKLITTSNLTSLFARAPNKGTKIRFLSLPESPSLSQNTLRVLVEGCRNLEYLNVSHCSKLKEIVLSQGEWRLLTRLEALGCPKLETFACYSPINILRIGTSSKISISLMQSFPEIFIVEMNLENKFEFSIKNEQNFEIKSQSQVLTQNEFACYPNDFDKYFEHLKIKLREYSISSAEELGLLITKLDLTNRLLQFSHLKHMTAINLTNLKSLNLSKNDLSDSRALILISGHWPLLEELCLRETKLTPKEIKEILKKSPWPQLRFLDVSYNDINNDGLAAFSFGKCPLLEVLDLTQIKATNLKPFTLVLVATFPNLKEIIFSKSETIKLDSIDCLFPEYFSHLQNLNLSNTRLTDKGLEKILKISKFPQLKGFNLSDNPNLSDEGLLVLARGDWPLLEEINIRNIQISSRGIQVFSKKAKLPNLQKLDISKNIISDQALQILASADWPQLRHLIFYETEITLNGVFKFLAPNIINWPNIQQLEFSFCTEITTYHQDLQSDILHGIVPIKSANDSKSLMIVLKPANANSKAISLSIKDKGFHRNANIISQEQWDQKESLILDFDTQNDSEEIKSVSKSLVKFIVLPLNLKTLSYINSRPAEQDLISIFSQKCPFLEELTLTNLEMSPKSIKLLVTKSDFPSLKKLHISNNQLKDEGLQSLASAKWPLLEDLNLAGTQIQTQGIKFMAANSNWPNLKKLDVSSNTIQEQGIETIVSAKWPLLEDLNLFATATPFQVFLEDRLKQEGIQLFFNKSHWPNLKTLDISQNAISATGLEVLASAEWPLLENLCLATTTVTTERLKFIVDKSNWPNLKTLDISANPIGDEGAEILTSAKWPLLEELNLWKTRVADKGIESMVVKSNWPNLSKLHLSVNPVGDKGLEILASANWPNLVYLDIRETTSTEEGQKFLKKAHWFKLDKLRFNQEQFNPDQRAVHCKPQ